MMLYRPLFGLLVVAVTAPLIFLLFFVTYDTRRRLSSPLKFESAEDFENFDNRVGTRDGHYLVPNFVHFIRFNNPEVSFMESVCILAALKNQRPKRLYIHTNVPAFRGKYWEVLLNTTGFREVLRLVRTDPPVEIFGQPLNPKWILFHGSDVTRLRILMEYGGIYLDSDSFIVRSLNDLRKYEMTLGWMENSGLANQVILAHKSARFLKLWLLTYKNGYNASQWYYNAGMKPTEEILKPHPELIHREKYLLANHLIMDKLYQRRWPEWKTHYAIHLLYNHQYLLTNISSEATYPVSFNESNILKYPVTIQDMVCDVYPMDCTGSAR